MSRIGNQPITLPAKVEVAISGGEITVKGPLGSLSRRVAEGVTVEKSGDTLVCKVERPEARALHGTTRALLANMVRGVSQGFERVLEINGIGNRAELKGSLLVFHHGFSAPKEFELPAGISAASRRLFTRKPTGVE